MKKIVIAFVLVFASASANAQFTVFQSVDVPHTSYMPSMGYGTPFTIYEPVESNSYQAPLGVYPSKNSQKPIRPKMQEVTLRGYFKKGNDWYATPIRVGGIGDEIRLLSVKTQNMWSNCGSKASEIGVFDSEEIRDNFNYKAFTSICGTVYF